MRLALASALAAALAFAGCSKKSSPPAAAPPAGSPTTTPPAAAPPAGHDEAAAEHAKKDPVEAKKLIAAGALVLDVREPDEFAGGHLPTAKNIPVDTVPSQVAQIAGMVGNDKTKPIVVYCSAGGRAARAKQALDAAGFTHVVNGGGYDDLK